MREPAQRLKMQAVIAQAERLRAAGDEPAAEAYLRRQPADTRIDLLLVDWRWRVVRRRWRIISG